jgi:prevent-host-death family protein
MVMREIAISEFKAKCLAILDEVDKTRQSIRITRHGKPVAEITPPAPVESASWIGSMKGTGKILGDIVSPASDLEDWEVFRD